MAATGTIGAAFFAILMWAERPSCWRSILFAVTLAVAVLSKFSSLAFLPAAALAALASHYSLERPGLRQALERLRPYLLPLMIAVLTACLLT